MALEMLNGVDKINGFPVIVMDDLKKERPEMFNDDSSMKWEIFERDIRPHNFIYVRRDKNSISFTLQNGPIKEVGVNGCQVDTLIDTARIIINGFNNYFPCPENSDAILHLNAALNALDRGKRDREARGVEGYSKT